MQGNVQMLIQVTFIPSGKSPAGEMPPWRIPAYGVFGRDISYDAGPRSHIWTASYGMVVCGNPTQLVMRASRSARAEAWVRGHTLRTSLICGDCRQDLLDGNSHHSVGFGYSA
jgi:hypothetical protein